MKRLLYKSSDASVIERASGLRGAIAIGAAALALLLASQVNAKVTSRGKAGGNVEITITDNRGVANYFVFKTGGKGKAVTVNFNAGCKTPVSFSFAPPPRYFSSYDVIYGVCTGGLPVRVRTTAVTTRATPGKPVPFTPPGLAMADVNQDTLSDVVVATETEILTFTNNGDGTFIQGESIQIPRLPVFDGVEQLPDPVLNDG